MIKIFQKFRGTSKRDSQSNSILKALDNSQAIIHFKMDGTIIDANKNFLNTIGYELDEIKGKHHSMFVEGNIAQSSEYIAFWEALNRGEYQAKEYKRIGKGGKEVWIQASYNPITGANGKLVEIVKYATDITEQVLLNADFSGQLKAINKAQAVIEFNLDGTIRGANENFLRTTGYELDEIIGKHHSIFVDENYRISNEYKELWAKLNRGEYQAAEFKRYGKGGKEIWIQASYNPIFDPDGKPFKVVKYATDITEQVLLNADFSGQLKAINKAQAVIEFNLDGSIITANENFLATLGYQLDEVKGKHHSLFIEPELKQSTEYKDFWDKLARGEYQSSEYKRIDSSGNPIWIQASYNPIFDPDGKPFKVVKYATDITNRVKRREESERVGGLVDNNLTQILNTVGDANNQAAIAATASTQTLQRVQSVAAAVEQFQASTQEIARNMEISKDEVQKATSEADGADQSAKQLTEAAAAMGNITEVISDIASQINLLALNASIESARAGEAGRGFAVVANEVKSLANQVATAPDNIEEEIKGMQTISDDVVSRLDHIKTSVTSVEDSVTTVSSAVEEQASASNEITQNMQVATTAVDDITTNLNSISTAVSSANDLAQEGTEMYRNLQNKAS
mgnify:FL=1